MRRKQSRTWSTPSSPESHFVCFVAFALENYVGIVGVKLRWFPAVYLDTGTRGFQDAGGHEE